MADRLVIMNHGRVVAAGQPRRARRKPRDDRRGRPIPSTPRVWRHCWAARSTLDGRAATALRHARPRPSASRSSSGYLLARRRASIVSLRTRASLEERYLELIADQREAAAS